MTPLVCTLFTNNDMMNIPAFFWTLVTMLFSYSPASPSPPHRPPSKEVDFEHFLSGESNRPLTPRLLQSIAIHLPFLSRYFCKSMPSESSWQKVVHTPPICITIRLPFVSRYFCRSIRVRGRWDTPHPSSRFRVNFELRPVIDLKLTEKRFEIDSLGEGDGGGVGL